MTCECGCCNRGLGNALTCQIWSLFLALCAGACGAMGLFGTWYYIETGPSTFTTMGLLGGCEGVSGDDMSFLAGGNGTSANANQTSDEYVWPPFFTGNFEGEKNCFYWGSGNEPSSIAGQDWFGLSIGRGLLVAGIVVGVLIVIIPQIILLAFAHCTCCCKKTKWIPCLCIAKLKWELWGCIVALLLTAGATVSFTTFSNTLSAQRSAAGGDTKLPAGLGSGWYFVLAGVITWCAVAGLQSSTLLLELQGDYKELAAYGQVQLRTSASGRPFYTMYQDAMSDTEDNGVGQPVQEPSRRYPTRGSGKDDEDNGETAEK